MAPELAKEKTYKQITDIIKDYHEPKLSAIVERYRFHTGVRKSDESVAEFVAALRGIARNCEFTNLEDQLRDRLVVGINNEAVQRQLLAEPKLTFKSVYEISQALEVTAKNTLDICGTSRSDRMLDDKTIHEMRQNVSASDAAEHLPEHLKNKYLRRGAKHNFSQPCPHRNTICNFCKKRGHTEKVCFAKLKSSSKLGNTQKNHKMQQADEYVLAPEPVLDTSLFFDNSEYDLFYEGGDSNRMVSVTVGINSQPVTFEVDTGASLTLISTDTFQKLMRQTPVKLDSVNTTLRTYTGEAVPLMGKCNVTVTYRDTEYVLTIHVVKGNGPNLIGRDWIGILPLNWSELFHVTAFPVHIPVVQKHEGVFKGESKVSEPKAKLCIDKRAVGTDMRPHFWKARPLAYALRWQVDAELERQESLAIITPVQYSEWAAPIVVTSKSDGSVRVCGDFSFTINHYTGLDTYPLPRVEDLHATIAGGEKFSKLVLSHAYHQVCLDDDSKEYVTINIHRGLYQYNRLPFGVNSACGIFQRIMDNLVKGIPYTATYLDVILVTGRTDDEHVANFDTVLQRIYDSELRLWADKCQFVVPEVSYLGFNVDKNGLHPLPDKIIPILELPEPTNMAEL